MVCIHHTMRLIIVLNSDLVQKWSGLNVINASQKGSVRPGALFLSGARVKHAFVI